VESAGGENASASMAVVDQASVTTPGAARRLAPGRRGASGQWLTAVIFLSPALIILGIFHIYPLFYAVWISTRRWRLVDRGFIGIDNYREALTNGDVWRSFINTVYFSVGTVPVEMVLALALAYLLFQKVRFLSVFRTIYFLPYVTSTVAAAAVWAWMFDSRFGLFNSALDRLGVGPFRWLQEPRGVLELLTNHLGLPWPGWAGGPSLALVAIMIMTIWHYLGFQIVVFLVGLGSVPKDLYEAAKVDGANERQLFFRITLPMLSPTILFVAVIATIGSFQSFNQIYQMSSRANVGARPGGPLQTTETMVIQVLNEFQATRYGYGAAIAIVLFLIILTLTLIQLRISDRWVKY
jgi:multiple sugar transport system permease protein